MMGNAYPSQAARWRVFAAGVAVLVGVFLIADSFTSGALIITLAFAVVYLVGAYLGLRNSLTGLVLLAALFAIDLSFVPFYDRATLSDWLTQSAFGLLNLVGLIAAVTALV